ncbi:hypothetical protein [Chitinimonas koreensis]|uniref:hypothetical protein n=1 Tax=Chitinimonas koreensis TaxID=356302 RepID=UPI00042207EF|nr:hypothetical protein [Chitinimonas koreensis]QNM95378.1 hypothetical protein H9L41_16080 [Chitinimonas koreensis]
MQKNNRTRLHAVLLPLLAAGSLAASAATPPAQPDQPAPVAAAKVAKKDKKAKKPAPARPTLKNPAIDAVKDMAGGLLKSVLGSAAKELLFPSKTIDTEKLLADISANVRKELIASVLDGDSAALTAATTSLNDYETEWRNGADPTTLEARVSADSTINGVNTTLARTGPQGMAEYIAPGLQLYIAAAQIKANRLELRRKLKPSDDAAIRAVLIAHLQTAGAHVRKTMNERRLGTMNQRLGMISDCAVKQKRVHGLPWNLITTYETGYTDSAVQKRQPGSQADGDEGIALARCEGYREPYFDNVRKAQAPVADKDWPATEEVLDKWAQSLDALKNEPGKTARMLRLDFGGMFGIGERSFDNPLTNATSCPAGYTAYEFKGTYNVDWQAFYCGRPTGDGEPVAEFGGMYGRTDHNDGAYAIVNSITGGSSCPAGFTAETVNNQHALSYCYRRHTAGAAVPYLFGGLYSDNGDKKNPLTDAMLCPTGYTPALVHGTRGAGGISSTRRVIMCYAKPKSA